MVMLAAKANICALELPTHIVLAVPSVMTLLRSYEKTTGLEKQIIIVLSESLLVYFTYADRNTLCNVW